MRFEILFISSLLVLAFAVNSFPPPSHGDIVRFQGARGPHHALVVGSPDKEGKHDLAPFRADYNVYQRKHRVYTDKIVKAHPDDIVGVPNKPSRPKLASAIESGHAKIPPSVLEPQGPVFGSKKYLDAAPPVPTIPAGLHNGKDYRSAIMEGGRR